MAKALLKPIVTVTKKVNLSWDDLSKRVSGKPNFVKVGLPDTQTTSVGDQIRKERRQGRRPQ